MLTPELDSAIKLLFVGPVGAGKTSAIRAIADTPPLSTDVPWTQARGDGKHSTTVAFDYSTIRLDQEETLHVYGLPGQQHLDFMAPIVGRGALGAVLLLDASSAVLREDCLHSVQALRRNDAGLKFVIGVTKADLAPRFSMHTLHQLAQQLQLSVPIFSIDARDRAQVIQLLRALLLML